MFKLNGNNVSKLRKLKKFEQDVKILIRPELRYVPFLDLEFILATDQFCLDQMEDY